MKPLAMEQYSNGACVSGEKEVLDRLEHSANEKSTSVLYEFGSLLLERTYKTTEGLDSKAQLSASFVGGIVALLVSTFSYWKGLITEIAGGGIFIFVGLILLIIATGFAVFAFRVQTFEDINEQNTWFAEEYMEFPDKLRRFHLIAMYRTVKSADQINCVKASNIRRSHYLLIAGTTVILLPILIKIWSLGTGAQLSALLNFLARRVF